MTSIFFFLLFLFTRLIFLTRLPIFNDEAIYLHWGLDFMRTFGRGVTPVTIGGKQLGVPLLFGLVQFLPFDPLILGRCLSVFFSCITYGITLATFKKLFPKESVLFLSLLLIFSPYLLFFDRFALIDSIIVAVYSLAFFLLLLLLEKQTTRWSITLGILLAFGWWMKSTILLAFPTIFLIFIIKSFQNPNKMKMYILSFLITLLTFFIGIVPVLLHPNYWKLPLQETERLLTFSELGALPISFWWTNIQQMLGYMLIYATPFVLFAFLMGGFQMRKKKELLPLLLWFFVPTCIELFLFRRIDSRYIVLVIPSLLLMAGAYLDTLKDTYRLFSFLTISMSLGMSFLIILSPTQFYSFFRKIPVIEDDFRQYVVGWPSGYGVKEAVEYVKAAAAGKPTFVFVRSDSGNPEDAVYVYLAKEKNIKVLPLLYLEFVDIPSYFISRGPQYGGVENRLMELARFPKPLDNEFIGVYQLK